MSRRRRPGAIDWADIRHRLDAAIAATERALDPSPERTRQLMEERARRLAAPIVQPPVEERLRVLTFSLARETYGIESRWVHDVARLTDLTPVPGAPRFVFGVTSWRGEVLPVLDLRDFLGLPSRGLSDLSRNLVLGVDRPEVGLLADVALDLAELPRAALTAPLGGATAIAPGYVLGVTQEALIVLDGGAILRDSRARPNQEN